MKASYIVSANIISALGFDSAGNAAQVSKGNSGIRRQEDVRLAPAPFHSSLIDDEKLNTHFAKISNPTEYTRLEKMLLLSLRDVIQSTNADLGERTGLIISTTKGNIDALSAASPFPPERAYLSALGSRIQDFFGFANEPIVVSNACVSGILAVAVAKRLTEAGVYDRVLVAGGDLVTPFVLSGFNSFQAVSPEPCRPFSADRRGITIGEAAASVLVTTDRDLLTPQSVRILGAATRNDANHISGPSRTGEGLYRSIQSALTESELTPADIDYISAHGTATLYNDEMEAVALNRVGLQTVPVNSLKGYYGHTLGASGLVETVIGLHALQENRLYASAGYKESGVSREINVIRAAENRPLDTFLKTASGFGGCNTAVVFTKIKDIAPARETPPDLSLVREDVCIIADGKVLLNDREVCRAETDDATFADFAKRIYKTLNPDYRKFFKMDNLSKLAFLAAECLFRSNEKLRNADPDEVALILSNRAASLDTDRRHQNTIENPENYFPSPAVFVYTLPNICLGEISIRHGLQSENAFFVFDRPRPEFLATYSRTLLQNGKAKYVICGWADFDGEDYRAEMYVLSEK